MGRDRNGRPDIENYRVSLPDFRDLRDAIRFHGTHVMLNEWLWIRELAIQTAAKSFNSEWLRDNQENFLKKMQDMRWVNGHNDVSDYDFSTMTQLWHSVVLEIIDDFNDVDVFEFDEQRYVMEINISKITEHHIDLERLLYKRARGPYD